MRALAKITGMDFILHTDKKEGQISVSRIRTSLGEILAIDLNIMHNGSKGK